MKDYWLKIVNFLKKVLIIITMPIWWVWKILFVRKPEKKFKNMPLKIKVFRIIRGFITKPLKFGLFLTIIGLEILVVYKVRFSVLTYPLTRSSVHTFYLKKANTTEKLLGIQPVLAADFNNHKEDFKTAFSYIDKWELDAKNKMYVILDSEVMKLAFIYGSEETVSYFLNRFNNDSVFREDFKLAVLNINKNLARLIKEFPEVANFTEFDAIFSYAAEISSYAVDYATILNIVGPFCRMGLKQYKVPVNSLEFPEKQLDILIESVTLFSKGMPLAETRDYINEKYIFTDNENNTSSSSEISY